MVEEAFKKKEYESEENQEKNVTKEKGKGDNRGELLSDATCAPADISYPNDLGLLNQARVGSEEIIDILYETVREKVKKKPKTYRDLARKEYLKVAKKRRPRTKERRKAIKKQLQYLKRNINHIEQLTKVGASFEILSSAQYKMLLVIAEVYRQQQDWLPIKAPSISDRL